MSTPQDGEGLTNHEVVVLALHALGGDSDHVDTEDVAIKTAEIAPGRFAWRKHPEQINLELIRVALSDAKKAENGSLLIGSGNAGWMLTEAGVRFAKEHAEMLGSLELGRQAISVKERQWRRRERVRMLSSSAYMKHEEGRDDEIMDREASMFFRLDDYVQGESRERKITRILNVFSDDPHLGELVQLLAERVRDAES